MLSVYLYKYIGKHKSIPTKMRQTIKKRTHYYKRIHIEGRDIYILSVFRPDGIFGRMSAGGTELTQFRPYTVRFTLEFSAVVDELPAGVRRRSEYPEHMRLKDYVLMRQVEKRMEAWNSGTGSH